MSANVNSTDNKRRRSSSYTIHHPSRRTGTNIEMSFTHKVLVPTLIALILTPCGSWKSCSVWRRGLPILSFILSLFFLVKWNDYCRHRFHCRFGWAQTFLLLRNPEIERDEHEGSAWINLQDFFNKAKAAQCLRKWVFAWLELLTKIIQPGVTSRWFPLCLCLSYLCR